MNTTTRISLILAFLLALGGCRTLHPPGEEENPQPWAQPEEWETTQGIPGFNSNRDFDY
jgi:hypothetical protein